MGDLIDLENIENIPRCEHAKLGVIIVNYIGVPSSFIILVISIFKMCYKKKRIRFLTSIILFIFFFEVMNTISKMLQLLKYIFEDTRPYLDINQFETPRGIICQIQIVTSIFSDLGCLLGTLLLSYRCYEVIKKRKRFTDNKKVKFLSITIITLCSLILAIVFLLIDRAVTRESQPYKFDLRDRCNYWCWLEHYSSIGCYTLYMALLIINIIYFCKIKKYLEQSYNNMKEKSTVLIEKFEEPKIANEINDEEVKEKQYISKDDRNRLKELYYMRIKCLVYPTITIIIWSLSAFYRIIDDSVLGRVDLPNINSKEEEKKMFDGNKGLQAFVETNLIFHTVLSAFRGTLYGFAFLIFEEKSFGDIFRKCVCKCCYRKLDFIDLEDEDEQDKESKIYSSTSSSIEDTNEKDNNEENQFRKSSNNYDSI